MVKVPAIFPASGGTKVMLITSVSPGARVTAFSNSNVNALLSLDTEFTVKSSKPLLRIVKLMSEL